MDTATLEQEKRYLNMLDYTPKSIHDTPNSAYEEFVLEGYRRGYEFARRVKVPQWAANAYKNEVSIEIIASAFELHEDQVRLILMEAGLIE